MSYFLYFLSFILFCYGIVCLFLNRKEERIFHILAYLVPFWAWGIIFLFISIFFWHYRLIASYPIISIVFFILFLVKGLAVIFLPKRKIKKNIEAWENFPIKKKKLFSVVFILMAFLIILIAI